MNDLNKKLFEILANASGINVNQLKEDTPIGASGIDSITFIEVIVKIEEELDIEIDDSDMDLTKYNTVQDLLEVVIKQL